MQEPWPAVTSVLAAIVAIANAWAMAANWDQKLLTLATLQTAWEQLRLEYSELWSKRYEDGTAVRFHVLQNRTSDLGMLASSGAPWDPRAVERWARFVDSEPCEEEAHCPPNRVIRGSWPPIKPSPARPSASRAAPPRRRFRMMTACR